jgi:predicted ATPase/class 3 adenylate cyclase
MASKPWAPYWCGSAKTERKRPVRVPLPASERCRKQRRGLSGGTLRSRVGWSCENVVVPTGSGGWYPHSFVLTDIVDSVSLWERDADQMAEAVARHDAMISREVSTAGGTVVRSKGEGDSTFSVFTHPAEAVAAAAAIQRAIGGEQWPTTAPVRVRAGVHTGDAEPRDGDWYGPAVNRAARLRALADGCQTLVSGVTASLVADELPEGMRLLYRGRRTLRGIERPEDVWDLVAADDPRLASQRSVGVGGLPVALTHFVGHTEDLDRLGRLIEGERLVTITGPGGSGKTRLALEVARNAQRRGGRVWLADLASLREAGLVAQAVANAVGVETRRDPLDELLAQADTLAGILVLDNCEHLLDACAALTESLLAAAPGIQVLATSREALRLAGEREWLVRPLDVPDKSQRDREQLAQVESVELLLDRARAVRTDLEVSHDEVASVVGICRALDGMPLAIELAAGRLRSLSFADLEARLGDQLAVLARGRPAGRHDARHQTLRMTLDWSYDLLGDQERTLAQRLSVFAGGFRLDAVEAVCGGLDVLDGVDELVAKSLVTFDGMTARYRLLEPLRQYLADRLDESGETEATRRAHAEWTAGLCERLGTRAWEEQKARTRRLRDEAGNIELALRWAQEHDLAMAVRIVGSLALYWGFYDQSSGRRWTALAIEASAGIAPQSRADALVSAAVIAQNDQAWDQSVAWLREALAIYRSEAVVGGYVMALFWLGRALASWSDPEPGQVHALEATSCFEEGLQLCLQIRERFRGFESFGTGWFRTWLSVLAFDNGDLDRSERLANQVIDECSGTAGYHPMGQAMCVLAFIARRRGSNDAALEFLQNAVAVYRDLDDPWHLSGLLVDLAEQEAVMGRGAEALQALAESSQLDEQTGQLPGRSRKLAVAAVIHLAHGQPDMSISALGAYDAHPPGEAHTLWKRIGGSLGWLAEAVEATRAQLDPAAVAAATATARSKSIQGLLDELIIQPAQAAV